MGRKMRTFAEQIERYAIPEPNTGCWLWLGTVDRDGYAKVSAQYKTVRAARVAYEVFRGPIPKGMLACHRCDNPPCVNPGHLFLGDVRDNAADMVRKGRSLRGDRNHAARLTPDAVVVARARMASGASPVDVATQLGITPDAARDIACGETWSHLGPPLRVRRKHLPADTVAEIRRRVACGEPRASIARAYGVTRKTVFNIASGRTRSV